MKIHFHGIVRNYYTINKIFLFLVVLVILVNLFPRQGKFRYEFQRGKPWQHEDLIAPFDFAILKSKEEVARDQRNALRETYPFFRHDKVLSKKAMKDFADILEEEWLKKYPEERLPSAKFKASFDFGLTLLDTIFARGIIEPFTDRDQKEEEVRITVLWDNIARTLPVADFFTVQSANAYIRSACSAASRVDGAFLLPQLQEALVYNVLYDEQFTKNQREIALANVSLTRGMMQKGERIISKGEIVNEAKFRVLDSFSHEYERMLGTTSNYRLIMVGRILLMAFALIVFALFMFTFRHDVYSQNRNIVLLLMLITLMTTFTTLVINNSISLLNAVPLCLVPIIVRTFYDTRLALFVHIITIIILGFLVPNSFEFLFMQLITGIITIISVVNLHRRSQFFFTSLMIFISYSSIYVGMILLQEGRFTAIEPYNFLLFGASALLTLFSYPLIFLFEKLFGLITDVSLIEYSDTNSRLLRELAIKAPGTFQHSLVVSSIAEDAARAIGCNPLLARTGALYHDIGKMEMPLYYIENQVGSSSPHEELSTEESARIIISHVINGVEMAKLHKLPEALVDFIRSHHGTRLTQFFYAKYVSEHPDEPVDEAAFRYHGPVPFSKETSIVMMADSVEAASRVMKSPSESRINSLVERIINDQMENRQFNNSELSIKDISVIKKIIKKKLLSIYHLRVEYPSGLAGGS